MKAWKRILCILMLTAIFTSCHATPPEQTSNIVASDVPTREEVFANRERSQRVVVETVKDFEFTVTLDREIYYVGDDINVRIVAKYTDNAEDYCLKKWDGYEDGEIIQAELYLNGERISDCGGMSAPQAWADDWFEEIHLSAGDCLENIGRFSTAVIADRLRVGDELVLHMRNTLGHTMDVPIALCTDAPQDHVFLSYVQRGELSQALYRRIVVMDNEEKIGVYIGGENVDPHVQFAGILWQSEPFGSEFTGYHLLMTREQIADLLRYRENHPNVDYRQLKYSYEYYFLGDWILENYPVEGVSS